MRRKTRSRAESGTCNVCSAPCSSCMHLRHMGSKGNEFSDETSHVTTTTSQQSGNEDNVLPSLKNNKANESSQPATSEASNLLSINSSHDSLSENAESKENMRHSDLGDASAESDVAFSLQSGPSVAVGRHSSKQKSVLDQRRLSNKHENTKAMEGHDESKDRDTSVLVKDTVKKNMSGSTGLVSSLGTQGFVKVLNSKSDVLECPSNDVASCGSPKLQSNCLSPTEHKNLSVSNDAASDLVRGSGSSVCNADGFPNGKGKPKLEAEPEKDSREQPGEVFNSADQVEQGEKLIESPDMQQPVSQYRSENESDESEIMEHDVKVCDICGDAGREDLLAICSRCSDGAEHTYCMREMLQKVPEGDWLCEECKLAEENDSQKQVSDTEDKRKNKLSTQFSGKRHMETTVTASTTLKRAIETSMGSPKSSSQKKSGALSRDSSFNSLEKGKIKPAYQTSLRDHSGIDFPENVRSHSTGPQLQTSKGPLLKSNSFNTVNSKPKVKLVDEVPQRQKSSRENPSFDMKEGPARTISKSMSFKSVNSGRVNATEGKVKMLPSKFSHVQDIKGLKQYKDRTAFERKSLSKLDRPLGGSAIVSSNLDQKHTPRGESVAVSSGSSYRDSKVQSEGKFGSLSRSSSGTARKGAEIPAASVRASSISGINNASNEQKAHLASPKDEPTSSSSWNADKQPHIVSENLQDSLTQRESTSQGEKTKEISSSRSKPASIPGLKSIVCQKCKDIGHSADYCTVTSPRASFTESPTGKSIKEEMSTGSKLKAAIEAAMLKKPGIYRKRKMGDQSDGLSMYSGDVNCDMASHDQILTKTHNVTADEESIAPAAVKFDHASSTTSFSMKMSVVPEHEHIWQGSFEVRRFGKVVGLHVGIQAHLSTCASPKVLEVVNKFPPKIILDEAPRLSSWPRQFLENGAKDDNIALYFFAKDIDSYEKNYRILVDDMIQKDLVLRGYFYGVELLIYASTQLPEHSQCWNMLFFLWGVFRGKRSSVSHTLENSVIPSLNVVPLDKEIPSADLPASENICPPAESTSKEAIVCESSCHASVTSGDMKETYFSPNEDHDKKVSSMQTDLQQQVNGHDFRSLSKLTSNEPSCTKVKCSSSSQEEAGVPEIKSADVRASIMANESSRSSYERKEIQMQQGISCDREDKLSVSVANGVNKISGEKMVENMSNDRDELAANLNKDNADVDKDAYLGKVVKSEELNSWQSNNKKRTYLDLSKTAPRTSSSTGQESLWNKADGMLADGESTIKKLKTGFSETHECSGIKDVNSLSKSLSSQIGNLGSSSSFEERISDKASDKQVILEDVGTAERYFFPVESHDTKAFQLRGSSLPWREHSSNDNDLLHDRVPNLELALGAETKSPNREALPFFVGMVEENNVRNKPVKATDREEEDSVSASLSLSLSFPFPEKDQTVKPVSKPEQIMPERRHVNTSLLLYGGFTDK